MIWLLVDLCKLVTALVLIQERTVWEVVSEIELNHCSAGYLEPMGMQSAHLLPDKQGKGQFAPSQS